MDITEHWLNVRQVATKLWGSRWNCHYGVEDRSTARWINGGWIFLGREG